MPGAFGRFDNAARRRGRRRAPAGSGASLLAGVSLLLVLDLLAYEAPLGNWAIPRPCSPVRRAARRCAGGHVLVTLPQGAPPPGGGEAR
ncbi:hypothetical protein [Streptomyces marianii]|uniref:Uncharacterized protein n=1 Tax=Streptomyces marianii TaxID=1817406 RepID=A0A5R9E4M6_9ACTN|nr:hypothetical protein [Streptomyces marianii]TLQ43812.1 hypothetical protein FEF34_12280 [Streptomyces marianii]